MTETINILNARNQLSRLVAAVEHGDEVIIARRGRPVARLVPMDSGQDDESGPGLVAWLAVRPPLASPRSSSELDAQVAGEREAWE